MNPAAAGLFYGALAFAIGAVLGPVRELVLAPLIASLPAAVLEALVMAALLVLAARAAIARLAGPPTARARGIVAGVAVALVLLLEALLGFAFDATGLAATRVPQGAAEHAVGAALLAWFAVLPFLLRRHARAVP